MPETRDSDVKFETQAGDDVGTCPACGNALTQTALMANASGA
jgi:hypothetical protein